MAEVGLLAPDARVELIEGEIIDMAPVGKAHVSIVDQLARLLMRAVVDGVTRSQRGPRVDLGVLSRMAKLTGGHTPDPSE